MSQTAASSQKTITWHRAPVAAKIMVLAIVVDALCHVMGAATSTSSKEVPLLQLVAIVGLMGLWCRDILCRDRLGAICYVASAWIAYAYVFATNPSTIAIPDADGQVVNAQLLALVSSVVATLAYTHPSMRTWFVSRKRRAG